MGVASIPAFCDLDERLHLQPGGMTHGGDLRPLPGDSPSKGIFTMPRINCVGQTGTMDMAVPIWIMISAPSKLGLTLLQSTPT